MRLKVFKDTHERPCASVFTSTLMGEAQLQRRHALVFVLSAFGRYWSLVVPVSGWRAFVPAWEEEGE